LVGRSRARPNAGALARLGQFHSAANRCSKSPPITDDIRDDPARVLPGGAAWDQFGSQVVSLGDLNGDGSGELGIVSRNPWAVHLEVGSPAGFQGVSTLTLGGAADDLFGVQVAGAATSTAMGLAISR